MKWEIDESENIVDISKESVESLEERFEGINGKEVMSEYLYKDYIPANARITIQYGKQENVKFSYPVEYTYWKAVRKFDFKNMLMFECVNFSWLKEGC